MKKLPILLAALAGFVFYNSHAQQVTGLQYSNYGGVYRATYNPSTLGGSRYKWQVNIGSLAGSINYRYFVFLGQNSFLYPILSARSSDELYGRSRTMGSLTQDPLYLVSDIRWPSAMFSVGKNHGFAVQFRTRGFVQGKNIPEPLRTGYFRRLDTGFMSELSDVPWGSFGLAQQSFSEMSVSYGVALINTPIHKIKAGATVKRIFGARLAYVQGNARSMDFKATGPDTTAIIVNNIVYEAGYSQPVQRPGIGGLLNADKYGNGWGFDLGVSYELGSFWKKDKEVFDQSPEYIVRLGASLTDIGSIKYATSDSKVIYGVQEQMLIDQKRLEQIADRGAEGFMDVFMADRQGTLNTSTKLPQAMHLEADVQLVKGFFLNLSQTKRFKADVGSTVDVFMPNSFTVTPRWEDEDSDFAFPISFIDGNKKATIGAVGHFGPIFLGLSNVNGLIKKGNARGSMMYIGVTAWKLKERKKPKFLQGGKK